MEDRGTIESEMDLAHAFAGGPRLLGLHLGSPLTVLLELPPHVLVASGLGLVYLAERICTFGPRVSATRKKALLDE